MKQSIMLFIFLCSIFPHLSTFTELSIDQNFQLWFLKNELKQNRQKIKGFWLLDENVRLIVESAELAVEQSPQDSQQEIKTDIINLFKTIGNVDITFTDENLIQLKTETPYIKKTTRKKNFKRAKKPTQKTAKNSLNFLIQHPAKIKGAGKTKKKILELRAEKLRQDQEARRLFIERLKELTKLKNNLKENPKYEQPTQFVYDLHHEVHNIPKPLNYPKPLPKAKNSHTNEYHEGGSTSSTNPEEIEEREYRILKHGFLQ